MDRKSREESMKRKTIPLTSIRINYPIRESPSNVIDLKRSIDRQGLRNPLLVNPGSHELISGYRRYKALQELRIKSARVALPEDVFEACEEVHGHFAEPGDFAVPITVRERVNLAVRLHELPKPKEHSSKFTYDAHSAPAVGLTSRILWRIRSTIGRAMEGSLTDDENVLAARLALKLMLEAVDQPPDGWTSNSAVGEIHDRLRQGRVPESLSDLSVAPPRNDSTPLLRHVRAVPPHTHPQRKRIPGDFRRGMDSISGALAGLTSFPLNDLPVEERCYAEREFKAWQQTIRRALKAIHQEA